jgi:hypothetical protein
MKNFSRLYVKYVIKTPAIFYLFLLIGSVLFLYLSIGIKLDVVQSMKAYIEDNGVIVEEMYELESNTIYLYNDRDDKIYKSTVEQIKHVNGHTVFVISSSIGLSGEIQVDIVTGSQTLFERIFIKAGKR